jgi:hypothetical protein
LMVSSGRFLLKKIITSESHANSHGNYTVDINMIDIVIRRRGISVGKQPTNCVINMFIFFFLYWKLISYMLSALKITKKVNFTQMALSSWFHVVYCSRIWNMYMSQERIGIFLHLIYLFVF